MYDSVESDHRPVVLIRLPPWRLHTPSATPLISFFESPYELSSIVRVRPRCGYHVRGSWQHTTFANDMLVTRSLPIFHNGNELMLSSALNPET
jgi:hypothetical protein